MDIEFRKFTDFNRGIMYEILKDAYSFDKRCAICWDENWKQSDAFFFDNPEIADKYGFVTCYCEMVLPRRRGMMSATEVVANMPLHSATVRVNKHKADWRGWKFMWPFALVFVFVFVIPILYAIYISFFQKQMIGGTKFVGISNYIQIGRASCRERV